MTADPSAALNHVYEAQLNSQYTPEELGSSGLYQQRGMLWHVIVTEDCLDGNRFSFWDAIYNPIWNFSLELNNLSMIAYMSVSADTFLDMFENLIVDMTAQLRDSLWRPLIPSMVILGAATLGYYAFIRQQAILTFKSAVWMIIAVTLGMYMLFAPGQVLALTSNLTTGASGIINGAVANVTVNDKVSQRCPGDAAQPQKSEEETAAMFAARQNGQMLWEGFSCRAWMAGLVGSSENARAFSEQHGMELLEATTITHVELEEQGYSSLVREKQGQYEELTRIIREGDLEDEDSGGEGARPGDGDDDAGGSSSDTTTKEYEAFAGIDGSHRLNVALGSALASLTGGLLILVASLFLLGYKLAFIVGMLLAPVFLLVGIHPGRGRQALLSWVGWMISLIIKQLLVMLMIGILTLFMGLILAMGMGIGVQSMMMLGLMIALILSWKPMWARFQQLGSAGDKLVGPEPGRVRMPPIVSKLARTTMRAGAAVATGGSALAATTGLPYAGKGRAAGAAARGLGRGATVAQGKNGVPAGLRRGEMNQRWGQVLDAQRATDGDNVRLRGNGVVNRMRDAMGARPTDPEWRTKNPVMAGFEAHRWQGMSRADRRAAVADARRDPQGYMNRLKGEREEWAARARQQKEGSAPPLTPHQQRRHDLAQGRQGARIRTRDQRLRQSKDRWAARR